MNLVKQILGWEKDFQRRRRRKKYAQYFNIRFLCLIVNADGAVDVAVVINYLISVLN